jgi:predicted nucleic-acid-binding Zn-ribbon protein
MKNTRKCPKCESRDIMEVSDKIANAAYKPNAIITSMVSVAFVTRFVCANCGYSEEWLVDRDLDRVKEKYGR